MIAFVLILAYRSRLKVSTKCHRMYTIVLGNSKDQCNSLTTLEVVLEDEIQDAVPFRPVAACAIGTMKVFKNDSTIGGG